MDLFSTETPKEIIRTLGFYQPFCSLMFHGKIETRWVTVGKKPPFPLGKYLFYSTKKKSEIVDLYEWCGGEIIQIIDETLKYDASSLLNGYALGYGTLTKVRRMTVADVPRAFVNYRGILEYKFETKIVRKEQWCLEFENVERINPYVFTQGKQGVGILKEELCHTY